MKCSLHKLNLCGSPVPPHHLQHVAAPVTQSVTYRRGFVWLPFPDCKGTPLKQRAPPFLMSTKHDKKRTYQQTTPAKFHNFFKVTKKDTVICMLIFLSVVYFVSLSISLSVFIVSIYLPQRHAWTTQKQKSQDLSKQKSSSPAWKRGILEISATLPM